jgi:hypothetical protein
MAYCYDQRPIVGAPFDVIAVCDSHGKRCCDKYVIVGFHRLELIGPSVSVMVLDALKPNK